MTAIKTAIMIACFMGIISSVINMAAPENGMKKHLMSILGLIALLAVLSPFTEDGFRLTLRDIDLDNEISISTEDAESEITDIFLSDAKARYDEYFAEVLNNNDIRTARVDTNLTISEEYELGIDHIEIELYDISLAETAESLIKGETPEVEVLIWQVEAEDEGMDIGSGG